jgi:hypothetical protein
MNREPELFELGGAAAFLAVVAVVIGASLVWLGWSLS